MNTLSLDYRRTSVREERKVYQGLDAFAFSLTGRRKRHKSVVENLRICAEGILEDVKIFSKKTNQEVHHEIEFLQTYFSRHTDRDDVHVRRGLAIICVASMRTIGYTPFLVQVMGALAVARGYLAEMATGEGKTLTVALAAALAGWSKRPCHVITANDYLATRDAEWLTEFYKFCGLTVGCVNGSMKNAERAKNYAASITYSTPKEVLADFLRDRLLLGAVHHPTRRLLRSLDHKRVVPEGEFVLRGLHWAIVDEADSVLIDEAVTPLIISNAVENDSLRDASLLGSELAKNLRPGIDYEIDYKFKDVHLRESALHFPPSIVQRLPVIWRNMRRRTELIRTALVAREFYTKGIHYVVLDKKIELVDEFTGRIMLHRTWQQGLHQAVEAKEGLPMTRPNETMASLSFQRFFRCYPKISGITGTASEASEELWQIYHMAVIKIPTNRPCIRKMEPTRFFSSTEQKWTAVLAEIKRLHTTGCPVLVGTRSIEASEKLSALLKTECMPHMLLNATKNLEEAQIVKDAGQAGQIMIATNMAGRGTDIALGKGVKELGGLHVIGTERHESARIDRQLVGRCARQGDPGRAQMFVSLEDDLIKRYIPAPVRTALLGSRKATAGWLSESVFSYAQRLAERLAYGQRKEVLKMDRWLDENLTFSGKGAGL